MIDEIVWLLSEDCHDKVLHEFLQPIGDGDIWPGFTHSAPKFQSLKLLNFRFVKFEFEKYESEKKFEIFVE